ncbi:MAG TPA: DUF3854 domain-containing protein [Steroidobacteraceae bacterium]|nr:DUF3854 domain-containing protein [Steroidobacteraceae bacterium]
MSLRQEYGRERGIKLDYLKRWGVKNGVECITVPVLSHDGKVIYKKRRWLPPRIDRNGNEIRFTNPKGQSHELNFLPLTNGKNWTQVLADPSHPIYFAESEFKAAAIAQLGYAAVTAGSVMGHRHADSDTARCLDVIKWWNRLVRIAFDNDVYWNPNVQDGLFDLAQELIDRGAKVEAWLLPRARWNAAKQEFEKLGADDFIAREGKEAFDACLRLPLTDPMFSTWGKYRSQPKASAALALNFDKRPLEVLTEKPPKREYPRRFGQAGNHFIHAAPRLSEHYISRKMVRLDRGWHRAHPQL